MDADVGAEKEFEKVVLGVYIVEHQHADASDSLEDFGIIIDGIAVLQDLKHIPTGWALLLGLIYCLDMNSRKGLGFLASFRGTVQHGLPLEIGDTVQILEKCEGWYRGFILKNPNIKFRCCGVTNHTDWFEVYNASRVPDSCCLEYSDNCGLDNPGTWWTASPSYCVPPAGSLLLSASYWVPPARCLLLGASYWVHPAGFQWNCVD
uniref:SH3 domain-containing protein n=1 Tax=Knipowitschia caucasica TaxID=637954 RepID=A0AAV2LQU5_KNICA